jgi:hypothetical protein
MAALPGPDRTLVVTPPPRHGPGPTPTGSQLLNCSEGTPSSKGEKWTPSYVAFVLPRQDVPPSGLEHRPQVVQAGGQVGVARGGAVPRVEGLPHLEGQPELLRGPGVLPLVPQHFPQVVQAGGLPRRSGPSPSLPTNPRWSSARGLRAPARRVRRAPPGRSFEGGSAAPPGALPRLPRALGAAPPRDRGGVQCRPWRGGAQAPSREAGLPVSSTQPRPSR